MPPASVNAISRASQAAAAAPASQIDANPNSFSLRDFVVDEDAANFTTALWKSIDQTAFVMAQREALEAFNVAKALRLSEQTAAVEHQRRTAAASSSSASTSASASASANTSVASESKPGPSSSASDFARQKSTSASSSLHERKPSSSASAAAQQSAQSRISLSTQPFYSLDNTASASSRATNSVSISSSASQSIASQPHRIEQRSLSKRELESPVTKLSISMSPYYSSASTSASSSASASASASSSSRTQTSDVTSSKRRRTERQPSTSPNMPSATQQYYQQQQQQQQLVASAIAVPQKSTATTRDVRPVQSANPKENHVSVPPTPVEPRSRRRSTTVNPSQPQRKIAAAPEPRDTFTATRSCTKCGTPVLSPRGQPSTETLDILPLLHLTCTKCQTMHCRGCFAPARCNRALVLASSSSRSPPASAASSAQCDGGSTCTVRTCCAAVRAIAIFEALSWFDEIYAIEADFGKPASSSSSSSSSSDKGKGRDTKEQRDAYVRMLISKTDVTSASKAEKAQGQTERAGSTRRFEDAFVRTLRLVCAWLRMPNQDDDDDDGKDNDRAALHASVPRLFMSSMLLEVVHVFLGNTNVRDWVAHAETYLAILDLLRRMLDVSSAAGSAADASPPTTGSAVPASAAAPAVWVETLTLAAILRAPMRRIESSSGLRRAVWGDASVRYEDPSAGGAAIAEGARSSLCDLVQHLEAHRRPLMALAAKITFAATVEKVNNLCDGISYLLLQQVVGGI